MSAASLAILAATVLVDLAIYGAGQFRAALRRPSRRARILKGIL